MDKLKGHWHSVNENESSYYHTLDINDSIVLIDATTLVGLNTYEFSLYGKNGIVQLPVLLEDYYPEKTSNYYIDEDTLYVNNSKIRYIKSIYSECRIRDMFADQMVEVKFHNCKKASLSRKSINAKYRMSYINVGKLKNADNSKQLDSVFIQVINAIITPKDLQEFVRQEKDVFDVHKKFAVCLNVDINTPKILLNSIYLNLNKVLTLKYLFKSCIDPETREIRYNRIR